MSGTGKGKAEVNALEVALNLDAIGTSLVANARRLSASGRESIGTDRVEAVLAEMERNIAALRAAYGIGKGQA